MSLPRLFLESLEPRIAPAVILAGPTAFGGQQYASAGTPFHPASTVPHAGTDPVFNSDNYYIALKAGDTLEIFNGSQAFTTFLTVKGGSVDAFFTDTAGTGVPTASELSGLSVSAGAKFSVQGNVYGDIVANLNAKTGLIETSDLVSNLQNIASIGMSGYNVGGTIGGVTLHGSIIAGGGISNVKLGTVTNIQSGFTQSQITAGGTDYHWAGTATATGTLTQFGSTSTQGSGFLPAAKLTGGSLSNITVNTATGLYAGGGGAGAAGGSISNVAVIADATGILIQGGTGGDGTSTVPNGGAGGQVTQVVMQGVPETSTNHQTTIEGGAGGSAYLGSTGSGGKGGAVSKVWVGYQTGSYAPSSVWLSDNISVLGGNGGDGVTAGNGGGVTSTTLLSATPLSAPGAHDIQVLGGNGGDLFAAGKKAGSGGAVNTFNIQDLIYSDPTSGIASPTSTVLVQGGNASSTAALTSTTCTGAVGGSVTNATSAVGALVGASFDFVGGAGSTGTQTGGAGGSVSNLQFGTFAQEYLTNLTVTGGLGGDATTGNAGAGGSLSGISAPISQLTTCSLAAGNGGTSGSGSSGALGGVGGSISSVSIYDTDTVDFATGAAVPTPIVDPVAGNGGSGFKGGGAGGSIKNFSFFASYATLDTVGGAVLNATAGNGGSALGTTGSGAAGGSLSGISFSSNDTGFAISQTAALTAGTGGTATGTGTAGAGGSITQANIQTIDAVSFTGGTGGNAGAKGRIGAGGTIGSATSALGVSAFSTFGSVEYQAGSAGSASGAPSAGASGGSILNAVASAAGDISFLAGNGSIGGAGGSITQVAFYGASGSSTSSYGNILVEAGTGGNAITSTGTAGSGGSVTNAAGYTSLGNAATVLFEAGNGGSATTGGKGGGGGSVTGLTLYGGNNTGFTDTFVTNTVTNTITNGVTTTVVTPGTPQTNTGINTTVGTDAFAVVAGDGGSGTLGGGLGGSISKVASANVATVSTESTFTTTNTITINNDTGTNSSTFATTNSSTKSVVATNPILNAIAAGNGGSITATAGGSVKAKGANGGSVTGVNIAGDIGVRTGEAYGFATDGTAMGGIFAGTGGINNNVGALPANTTGLAGNVTSITAQAITAIVAGRDASPQLVNQVNGIYLGGETAVKANADGSFSNFNTANLVGGKDGSPTSTNAVNFQTSTTSLIPSGSGSSEWTLGTTDPLDGLVAALTLTANRNFTPLAFLTNAGTAAVPDYELYLPPVPLAS